MARKSRNYSRIPEASEIIKKLCEKHSEAFWCIKPESVVVMGIDNMERTEKSIAKQPIWSKFRNIKGVEKAIFQENNIGERFIIEVYWSDWHLWSQAMKAAILSKHLFEITPDPEVKNPHDCVGFKILYDVLGVNWERKDDSIPDLLDDDIKFNLDLRPGLEELEEMEDDDI